MRFRTVIRTTFFFLTFLITPFFLDATPDFAERTGKTCALCHDGANGGPLTPAGKAYIRNGYDYPVPKRILEKTVSIESSFHGTLRGILGIIHLITAAVFVGTIFFVHLFLKPRSLTGGIPRGEKQLGLACLSILTATGIYLTWYRLDTLSAFFDSRFGVLLFIKIVLFILLAAQGVLAVTFINKRMKQEARQTAGGTAKSSSKEAAAGEVKPPAAEAQSDGTGFDITKLSMYDGKEGRPAYVLYKDTVYDVTESAKWKEGAHFTQHAAGKDLTSQMENAPHTDEVLSRFPIAAVVSYEEKKKDRKPAGIAQRIFPIMAYINLALVMLILLCVGMWLFGFPRFDRRTPDFALIGGRATDAAGGRTVSGRSVGRWTDFRGLAAAYDAEETACIECHLQEKPALAEDWGKSVHAKVGVSCADCHKSTGEAEVWISDTHFKYSDVPVTPLVTPSTCARCHQEEVDQYARSKHANTLAIINQVDKWLIHGMNNEVERSTGCFACHGSVVEVEDGRPVEGTWPNVGVGRLNPDGSRGSCTSCHTRHRFSIVEARKPEACDQCHLGPDHPQIEIYNESKHGTMYHAYGDDWTWRPEDFHWTAGRDYRAPTCAACHMSEAGRETDSPDGAIQQGGPDSGPGPLVEKSHDVTQRLAWELQAPLTIRPSEFGPLPAGTDWREEREKMRIVCLQCHSEAWTDGHFQNMDSVIEHYNNNYYKPVKEVMDRLYEEELLTEDSYFDEELEWEFYELWHHEGRRARMGAAMMAPDYAWWHGFYECKHRFMKFLEMAEDHTEEEKGKWTDIFPGKLED